jgi:nucleoside-diphosphate-sugar epimerase
MRYLVTGGAGFIGSNTVDELVRRGHGVVVLDDLSSGKEENLNEVRNKITFVKGSVTDLEAVQKAMQQAEFVIHLAARTSVPRSVKDPLETNRINVDGTLNVLVAARDNRVKRVVFAASSSAYGETPTLPKVESMQPQPISPYGVSKYVGELYAHAFGRCYGLENVSVRYFNIFGPRQDPIRPIRVYCPALPRRFWTKSSRLSMATASKPATSPMWRTPCRPISSPAKLRGRRVACLTSGPAGVSP